MISYYFRFLCLLIALCGYGAIHAANTTVNVTMVASASEVGLSPGSFIITRTGDVDSSLTVLWQIDAASTADTTIPSADYTVSGTTGTSIFPPNQSSVTITLTPKADALVEGRETVILELIDNSNDYDLGSDRSARMNIADANTTVQLTSTPSTIDESLPTEPGRFRASFSPTTTRSFSTDLIARLSTTSTPGHAVKGNDYTVTYRVGGSDPNAGKNYTVLQRNAYQVGVTQITVSGGSTSIPTDAHIAFAGVTGTYDSISGMSGTSGILTIVRTSVGPGTGLAASLPNGTALTITLDPITGFKNSPAYTSGQTQISVTGGSRTIPAGSTITFAGDTTNYVTSNGLNAVTGTLTITPALTRNLAINSAMTITPLLINNFVVLANDEPIGSTTLKLSGGTGAFVAGDLFRIGTGTQMYLVSDWDNITKVVTFARFPEGGGIPSAISTTPPIVTVFPAEYTGSDANEIAIKVPGSSSHIDYFISPNDDPYVEGEEVLNMSLISNPDVTFANASANMRIADNNATIEFTPSGNVNATKGGNDGSFLLTVTPSTGFPSNVQISYEIKPSPDTTAVSGTDYVTLGTFEFPANTATATIPVHALTTNTSNKVLTLGLKQTNDYRVAGSSTAGISINQSQGFVSIAAKTGFEVGAERHISATQVPAKFTVTLNQLATTNLNIVYSLPVPLLSPATPGIDYSITGANYTLRTGQVTILRGASSADIVVTPIDDTTPESRETVALTLIPGQGYTVSSTAGTATVNIDDDEPVISIIKTSDSAENGASGLFTISYPLPALNRDILIDLTYSGTAVTGDYTATALNGLPTAVIIKAGERSSTVTIAAVDDTTPEITETLIATITPKPTIYTINSTAGSASMNIADDEPVVGIIKAPGSADSVEGGTSGVFTVGYFPPALNRDITVDLTYSGTATTGDYTSSASSGTPSAVIIKAGEFSSTVTIAAIDDTTAEGTETIIATITPKPAIYTVGIASATMNITDNEPVIKIEKTTNTAEESSTAGSFRVYYDSPIVARDIIVSLSYPTTTATARAADFASALPTTVTILSGTRTISLTMPLAVYDGVTEGVETLECKIDANASSYTVDSTLESATLTIADKIPTFTIDRAADATEGSTANNGKFVITSSFIPKVPFTVAYTVTGTATPGAAAGGTNDYKTLRGTVQVSGLTTNIEVEAFADSKLDPQETVIVTLTDQTPPSFKNLVETTPSTPLSATLHITDALIAVVSVTSTSDNITTLTLGNTAEIKVLFSQPLTVTGSPTLTIETGLNDTLATYSRIDGYSLFFTYTVRKTDSSTNMDYSGTNALSLNGGTILNLEGTPANLTLKAPGTDGSLGVGLSRPINGGLDGGKPAPGTVGSGSGGGCGLGSGFAALAGLCILAGMMVSIRRVRR